VNSGGVIDANRCKVKDTLRVKRLL